MAVALFGFAAWGQTAAEVGRQLRAITLEAEQCYRVRDLRLPHEELKLYFNDGYLIFARPVAGRVVAAVFSAQDEGGDGEVLVMPPDRGERMSLASFIKAPNLSEHFRSALLLFSDNSGSRLLSQIEAGSRETSKDRGLLLADNWRPVLQNLAGSFQVRLVRDLLSAGGRPGGVFFAAVNGERYGNFDLIYDPESPEQITVGQVNYRDNRAYFDVWTGFESRAVRTGRRRRPGSPARSADYRIEASIGPDLAVDAFTRFKFTTSVPGERAIPLYISQKMEVTGALIDGEQAEIFERESLRADLLRHDQNHALLLVAARPIEPGREHEVEIRHRGEVISDAGNGVFFVGARGGWYPRTGFEPAAFDMRFRYPKALDLVATGEITEQRAEGNEKITRVRSGVPIRLAGFNLGRFEKAEARRGNYTVEIAGNQRFEQALERNQPMLVVPPRPTSRRIPQMLAPQMPAPARLGGSRLAQMAAEIADAFQFMAERLGAPPLKRLTGSPIPGSFGQGYPGLLYLSTLYYLAPGERPASVQRNPDITLFLNLLGAHETAHQWWGNAISAASYHDEWMMEAFANYMALLYLEKKNGRRALDGALDLYRRHLLEKTPDGRTVESIGPITAGVRLRTSAAPDGWRIITYEKGSWILHMLRGRMGDEGFQAMLAELAKKYQLEPLTTEALREEAKKHLPAKSADGGLDDFFDSWVYGTGIPALTLDCAIRAKDGIYHVEGSIARSQVAGDFSTLVPLEIRFARAKPVIHWLETGPEPVRFRIPVRQRPTQVTLDPHNTVLAVKR